MDTCAHVCERSYYGPGGDGAVLRGRGLRYVLVAELIERNQPTTVAELVQALAAQGFELAGRASKLISDALRWEVARGRIVRERRGVYRYHRAPRSTRRRIILLARRARAWIDALRQGDVPPPTPPNPRPQWPLALQPTRYEPPWQNMAWLWVR